MAKPYLVPSLSHQDPSSLSSLALSLLITHPTSPLLSPPPLGSSPLLLHSSLFSLILSSLSSRSLPFISQMTTTTWPLSHRFSHQPQPHLSSFIHPYSHLFPLQISPSLIIIIKQVIPLLVISKLWRNEILLTASELPFPWLNGMNKIALSTLIRWCP